MRKINKLILHCTATPEGREVTKEDLRRWHVQERGWQDIGYHYFIDLKGELHQCRPVERAGAHSKGHNHDSIGIAYAGGTDDEGNALDTRTEAQKKTLENLLCSLKTLHSDSIVYGHRDFSTKECPSFDAKKEYEWISNKFEKPVRKPKRKKVEKADSNQSTED